MVQNLNSRRQTSEVRLRETSNHFKPWIPSGVVQKNDGKFYKINTQDIY